VVAGDLASVKAAIDRRSNPQPLPTDLQMKINQWSTSQDAWGISAVPPASLAPVQAGAKGPNAGPNAMMSTAKSVQQAYGGLKFGTSGGTLGSSVVVFTGEAVCDTAANASALGDLVKFMINLAQMQNSAQDPKLAALANSVTVTPSGTSLKISATLPQDVFTQMMQPAHKAGAATLHQRK
jgi:hypothetical protein